MKLIISILLLLGVSVQVNAQKSSLNKQNDNQDKTSKELLGDKYAFSYSYEKAITTYSNTKDLTLDGKRNLAMSYQKMDMFKQADSMYLTFINSSAGIIPEDYYNYAQVLKKESKITQSDVWMDKFANIKPNDLRAIDFVNSRSKYSSWLVPNKSFSIEHLKINSNAMDFSPVYYKDKIVFTSSRADGKVAPKGDNWHKEPYLDIYVADVNDGQLVDQKRFGKVLNGKMHNGPASFSKDGNFVAFTRNNTNDKSKDRVVELQIFFSNYIDGKWSEPEAFTYNNPAYSVGHPSLSADGNTMYFASDMAGGFGKADVYKTTKVAGGSWTKPQNLGNKINTEGDELFPFFEEKSKLMFFSSDGHYGLGGLDIFICEIIGNEVGKSINPGTPINTVHDDFSAIANSTMTKGYFASNRPSGKGFADLYSFNILKNLSTKSIKGITKQKSGGPIPFAMVSLIDENNKIIDSLLSDAVGAFRFRVEANKNYTLQGRKSSYLDGNSLASTMAIDSLIIVDIIMLKKPIAAQIKENNNLVEILELKEIYFDYDKSRIRPDAKIELDKIVKIMNQYPNMKVKFSSHADCRSTASYNQALSERRAIATAKYLKSRISYPSRLSGKGYGEVKLSKECPCENGAETNCSEAAYQRQRNTEFTIIK